MPIFDRNRIVVTCDFDDNIAVVGGNISGTVNIFVLEPVTLCGASLRYHVDESYSIHHSEKNQTPNLDRCSFQIEYVLFGQRDTKKSAPISVEKGHYKYPFVIPIPSNCPPSSCFGGTHHTSGDLKKVRGKSVSIRVDHRVDVSIFVAHSLMDKQRTYTVPMVVKCTSPNLLNSQTNGREAHLKDGMSKTFASKGILRAMLGDALSSKTLEQAHCDLFLYNVSVSLAETPFLNFAIRGVINCPYYISIVRVITYGGIGSTSRNVTEEIVGTVAMPPLDSHEHGQRGKIIISPHALQSSTSFTGRYVSCQFFVTMSLVYTSGVDAGIADEHKVRIPIDISHGSLTEEAVPGLVAATIDDGTVMGYTCPAGHEGRNEYVPIGPVLEGNIAPAAWGGTELRYNRQAVTGSSAAEASVFSHANKNAAAGNGAAPQVPSTRPSQNNNTRASPDDYYPSDSVVLRSVEANATDNGQYVTPGTAFMAPSNAYPLQSAEEVIASEYSDRLSNTQGPIFDENGRPLHRGSATQPSSKSSAPLPPQ